MTQAASSLETQQRLSALFASLHRRMLDVGLSLSLVDTTGQTAMAGSAEDPLESVLFAEGGLCQSLQEQAAQQVFEGGQALTIVSPGDPVILAAPVFERRRMVAAAVACYCPREMVDEEAFHAACDKWGLDFTAVASAADRPARHSAAQADHLLRILQQSVDSGLSLTVANDDVSKLSLNLATTYEELSLIYHISGTMKLTEHPGSFIQREICQGLLDVLNISTASAIVFGNTHMSEPDEMYHAGSSLIDDADFKALVGGAFESLQAEPHRVVDNGTPGRVTPGPIQRYAIVPMLSDGMAIGAVAVFNKHAGEFDSVDVKLMRAVADQAAVFLTNHRLYTELRELLIGVLDALTASIDAKDPYTCGHSRRVARISRRLAEASGIEADRVERIYLAGVLHDVGKIGVPEAILCKPGRLTDDEYKVIQQHPVTSAKILSGIRQLEDVVVGMLHHHERMDGKGYPDGLAGQAVPLEARIIGLADAFDALTTDRVYRKAPAMPAVIEEIRRNSGTQFDTDLMDLFLSMDLEAFLVDLRTPDNGRVMDMPEEAIR